MKVVQFSPCSTTISTIGSRACGCNGWDYAAIPLVFSSFVVFNTLVCREGPVVEWWRSFSTSDRQGL